MKLNSMWGSNLVEYIYAMHGHKVVWDGKGECPF